MIKQSDIQVVIDSYLAKRSPTRSAAAPIRVGVLGSHSALEIGYGAKQEGLETVVICEKGREKTYQHVYRNLFDHLIVVDRFADLVNPDIQEQLRDLQTIFVPNRSFACYVGYDEIEKDFLIPLLGNRFMLRAEERTAPRNQYYLLDQAELQRPLVFSSGKEIDRTVIVKVQEQERRLERAFFFASSPEKFTVAAAQAIEEGRIKSVDLDNAVIEEYVQGALFNANFFWSPLTDELDFLGFDRRIQTDLDGLLHMPAEQQLELQRTPQNIEIGHIGVTMRESQLEKIWNAGRRFVDTCLREYPPGIIGLFALQGAITRQLEFVIFDVSLRIPGCPCVEPTSPYMKYKYFKEVGPGRRVAMEILHADRDNCLGKIIT
ncbi:DUF1297 domain-containing protein [Candidatus Bipolaricaulota bacterium]|nr:DUF1297 domain-containing protein [Candidatus Bipolaricaulota bacterium]HBR10374.1 5-formaminoimidazole-4-carboxamide-1-(beta)-D-ribofuranosyl 5'-monophosphate synthetase [Candidatus Acetothermia bacterium]